MSIYILCIAIALHVRYQILVCRRCWSHKHVQSYLTSLWKFSKVSDLISRRCIADFRVPPDRRRSSCFVRHHSADQRHRGDDCSGGRYANRCQTFVSCEYNYRWHQDSPTGECEKRVPPGKDWPLIFSFPFTDYSPLFKGLRISSIASFTFLVLISAFRASAKPPSSVNSRGE